MWQNLQYPQHNIQIIIWRSIEKMKIQEKITQSQEKGQSIDATLKINQMLELYDRDFKAEIITMHSKIKYL